MYVLINCFFKQIVDIFLTKLTIKSYKRYKILYFQIRAPGGHDTTFIISIYTINIVKYNNYYHQPCLSQIRIKGSNSSKIVLELYILFEYILRVYSIYSYIYIRLKIKPNSVRIRF